jgi:TolB protein
MTKLQSSSRSLRHGAIAAIALLVTSLSGAQTPAGTPAPSPAPAASPGGIPEVVRELRPGQVAQLPLAIPTFKVRGALSPAARQAANDLERTVRTDLERTGYFVIQGPEQLAAARLTGDQAHDFAEYLALGNKVLLVGELYEQSGRLVLEGRVYDLPSGRSILGKRYVGGFDLARRMGHTLADEVVLYLTGFKGIALTSIVFTSDRTGFKEIFRMDYDGVDQRAVTGHKSTSMSPDWSPAGDAIAYVSFYAGPAGIYMADLGRGLKRPLLADGVLNISPTFSPDGQRVAFSRSVGGNMEIFVANRDGGGLKRLTNSQAIDTNPVWSPKPGNLIAFTSSRAGHPTIYLMDVEGTGLRRLTFEGEYNDGASWSPEGDLIAYTTRRGGRFQVAVTNVLTNETKVVTSGSGENESPSFSPDGRKLAFTSRRSGTKQIYVIDRDGSNLQQLTTAGNNDLADWSSFPPT